MYCHHGYRRLSVLPVAVTAVAALASGCGGSGHPSARSGGRTSDSATASATARSPGAAPDATAWCTTADFLVSVHGLQPAAGNRYAALQFTNVSVHPCRTQGYPGLQLIDSAAHRLPTQVLRDHSMAPKLLVLAPGGSAWARLHWSAVAGPGDNPTGDCQPPPAAVLVIAPDETRPTAVAWSPGPVCQRGRIDELPLVGGAAPTF